MYTHLYSLRLPVLLVLLSFAALLASSAAAEDANTPATTTITTTAENTATTFHLDGFTRVLERAAPIVGLVFGPVLCVFGLAWYAYIAQVLGFAAGGALFAFAALLLAQSDSSGAIVFCVTAFVCGGALVGALVGLRPAICTFAAGSALGVALAFSAFAIAGVAVDTDTSPFFGFVATTLAVASGALAVHYERIAIVASTSVTGAFCWLYGVGYYAGAFPTWRGLFHHSSETAMPWASWLYVVAFVALVAWSVREQLKQLYQQRAHEASHPPVSTRSDKTREWIEVEAVAAADRGARTPTLAPATPATPYQRI